MATLIYFDEYKGREEKENKALPFKRGRTAFKQ
jgi:hypothetical protein